MNVLQCVDRIRQISRIAAQIDVSLDELHGIDGGLGLNLGEPKVMQRLFDDNIAEIVLKRLLETQDLATLRSIETLIYSGRGDGSPRELKKLLPSNHESKDDVVRTILEKRMSLDLYLEEGLARAKQEGFDLETF